jgi:peptidoglycan/LPS O-acetylase OafA/YrhL
VTDLQRVAKGQGIQKASVERLTELDALRGIAALIVLLHHAAQLVPWDSLSPEAGWAASLTSAVFDRSPLQVIREGRQAVLFFFVLSGYVVTLGLLRAGTPGLLAFATGRTVRLLLPVAASVALSLAARALVFDPEVIQSLRPHSLYTWWDPVEVRNIVMHLALVGSDPDLRLNVVLWSLVHEWRTSVFLPFMLLFRGSPMLPVAFGCVLYVGAVFLGTSQDAVQLDYSIVRSFLATAYFALPVIMGSALALLAPLTWPNLQADRWAVAMVVIALFSVRSDLALFLGSVLIIALASTPGSFRAFLRRPALAWLGRVSFSLYLVHTIVLATALHAMSKWLPLPVIAALGIALSLPVAAVFYRIVELPSQRLARRATKLLARVRG